MIQQCERLGSAQDHQLVVRSQILELLEFGDSVRTFRYARFTVQFSGLLTLCCVSLLLPLLRIFPGAASISVGVFVTVGTHGVVDRDDAPFSFIVLVHHPRPTFLLWPEPGKGVATKTRVAKKG